jgi:hypothetical protein
MTHARTQLDHARLPEHETRHDATVVAADYPVGVAWRGLGVLLALAIVGGGVGFGVSSLTERAPASTGTPAPISAERPDHPSDPVIRVLPDPDLPPLGTGLPSHPAHLGRDPFGLTFPVPVGWTRNDLAGNEATWAVATNPPNTYLLRVEIVVSQHETIKATQAARIAALDGATQRFRVERQTDDAMIATYVYDDYRRLTIHRWITFDDPDPGGGNGSTYAEIAATGRVRDRLGLADLVDRAAEAATR